MNDVIQMSRVGAHDMPLPSRETEGSAGYDLRASGDYLIHPGEQVLVKTGWAWEIPEGWVGLIRDRSGMAYKHRLTTRAGVIDSDYRGEVGVLLSNERAAGSPPYMVQHGDRIAQMVLIQHGGFHCAEAIEVSDTARGVGGFGHTGHR